MAVLICHICSKGIATTLSIQVVTWQRC